MRPRQRAVPGIIGGLGPLAHITFEQHLLAESKRRGAQADEDHPSWILVCASDTPDRTRSLQTSDLRCSEVLLRYALMVERAGADFIVVTCNTAHAFREAVQSRLSIPWIDLVAHTVRAIELRHSRARRIGLLATDGTLHADLYQRRLRENGRTAVVFEQRSPLQTAVMDAIYAPLWGIKSTGLGVSTRAGATIVRSVDELRARGAEVVVAGCTELSVALREHPVSLPWIDPLQVAAGVTLDLAYTGLEPNKHLRELRV